MIIKIGDDIFDPNDLPCMIVLSKADRDNIARMLPEADRYAAYPDRMTDREVEAWMDDHRIPTTHEWPVSAITGGAPCHSVAGTIEVSGKLTLETLRQGLEALRAQVGRPVFIQKDVMVRLDELIRLSEPVPISVIRDRELEQREQTALDAYAGDD